MQASCSAGLFVVVQKTEDVVLLKAITAFEEVEFDGEGEARDLTTELLHQFYSGFHGAAGGKQVIDKDYALAGLDGIEVNLEHVGAVFEIVGDTSYRGGQLTRLADGNEAGVETIRQSGTEDETT